MHETFFLVLNSSHLSTPTDIRFYKAFIRHILIYFLLLFFTLKPYCHLSLDSKKHSVRFIQKEPYSTCTTILVNSPYIEYICLNLFNYNQTGCHEDRPEGEKKESYHFYLIKGWIPKEGLKVVSTINDRRQMATSSSNERGRIYFQSFL